MTPLGMKIEVRPEFEKALYSMVSSVVGNVTVSRFLHPVKVPSDNHVMPSGITTEVRPELANTRLPNLFNDWGNVTDSKFWQF